MNYPWTSKQRQKALRKKRELTKAKEVQEAFNLKRVGWDDPKPGPPVPHKSLGLLDLLTHLVPKSTRDQYQKAQQAPVKKPVKRPIVMDSRSVNALTLVMDGVSPDAVLQLLVETDDKDADDKKKSGLISKEEIKKNLERGAAGVRGLERLRERRKADAFAAEKEKDRWTPESTPLTQGSKGRSTDKRPSQVHEGLISDVRKGLLQRKVNRISKRLDFANKALGTYPGDLNPVLQAKWAADNFEAPVGLGLGAMNMRPRDILPGAALAGGLAGVSDLALGHYDPFAHAASILPGISLIQYNRYRKSKDALGRAKAGQLNPAELEYVNKLAGNMKATAPRVLSSLEAKKQIAQAKIAALSI